MQHEPDKKTPAKDPAIRKGPMREPTRAPPEPRRDPLPRGPEGERKIIDDPKPEGEPPGKIGL